MPRKKGGLGQPVAPDTPEDLLDTVFGAPAPSKGADTPPTSETKPKRLPKYFQVDRDLVKKMKVYAVEHDLKEQDVIEKALRLLFAHSEK